MIEHGKLLQQRYRIERQVGQGGMGAVYIATDERFGTKVAIKQTLIMDENYQKATEREARLLNSLKHPALPRVSDHFFEDDGQFLVMEYISGEDLGFLLERDIRPFDPDRVAAWADQLLDALDYLHTLQNPVIHRDIKPQNLKVNDEGKIILLDFGLAKGSASEVGNLTAAKSVFGYSRNYASLEQIQGTGTDPRSDIYSLAATLYHLATGEPPADALTRAMAVLSKQSDPLVPANFLRQEISAGFAGILSNSMDLDANLRPASAAEMRQMLKDPEKYEHFASANGDFVPEATSPSIFAQQTRLMPGRTEIADRSATEAKTAIMSGGDVSQITAVRIAGSPKAVSSAGKGRKAAAAAAALLLAAGLSVGGYVYLAEEETGTAPAAPTIETSAEASNIGAVPDAATASPAADVVKVPDEQVAETTERKQDAVGRPVKENGTRPAAPVQNAEHHGVVVAGDEVDTGEVTIKGDRIETPELVITEEGFRRKEGKKLGPLIDFRHMTPEQAEKLRGLEKMRQFRLRRTERPPEPPKQPNIDDQ